MSRTTALSFAIVASLIALHSTSNAQDLSTAEADSRASAAIDCLTPIQRRLTSHIQLLREAKAQLASSDGVARADAARAVVSLEQRVMALGEALRNCVPSSASLEPEVRVQDRTGSEAAVGERNDATPDIERDVALRRLVHVVVAERVDGAGQAPADTVRRAVRGIGDRLQRCYEQFLENGALQSGTAILSFTIDGRGRIVRPRVEQNTLRDSGFSSCLRQAARRMRANSGSVGGDARYSYTLRFGTEQ